MSDKHPHPLQRNLFSREVVRGHVREMARTVTKELKAPHKVVGMSLTEEHHIKLAAVAEGLNMNMSECTRCLIDWAWEAGNHDG